MAHVLIIHRVADYAAWKAVFDGAADIRREAGERSYQVLCADDDERTVVHVATWTSTAAARVFFESPRLQQIRAEAGVEAPQFLYLDQRDAGTLEPTPDRPAPHDRTDPPDRPAPPGAQMFPTG